MENNSISARIRRRNKQGFQGVGTPETFVKTTPYGDYNNPKCNHKDKDYKNALDRKNKLHFVRILNTSQFRKKYADNHQKL